MAGTTRRDRGVEVMKVCVKCGLFVSWPACCQYGQKERGGIKVLKDSQPTKEKEQSWRALDPDVALPLMAIRRRLS